MAAPGFVLRLRTPQGMKRLNFSSNQDTFAALKQQVQLATGVAPDEQALSTTDLKSPSFLQGPPSRKLVDFRLNHGDILYMVDASPSFPPAPAAAAAAAKPSAATPAPSSAQKPPPPVQLSKLCQHGPRGRCVHCDGVPVGVANPVKVACNHGPNAVCPNCSAYVQDKNRPKDEVAPWLCNHPETAFCPKCIPKEPVGDDGKTISALKCSCNKAKGQQCLICMDKGPVIKVNFLPFAMYLEERRGMCKFAHPANQVCASCAPPKIEDYKGKANCDRGHKPWPYGVCLNCAPANANIRLQKFRHCDTVSFEDVRALQRFYSDYMKKGPENERAGVLFGSYTNEPPTTQLHGAIRAQVQAVYQPPQEAIPKGMRFLRDPNEEHAHKVAAALGLQPVGWVVATFPRSGPKYGGKVFMSGLEIKQAARFQNRYKHSEQGYSRFVTVVVEYAETVAPEAYQVSDQCVALERDGVLAMAPDAYMLATHAPQKGEIVPSVVYKDKPLVPGVEFVPDEFIVRVIVTQPEAPRPLLRYNEFPSNGSEADARGYFQKHSKEAYHIKLSDFNLLVFLSANIGLQITTEACAALLTGTPFPDSLKNNLDKALTSKKLI